MAAAIFAVHPPYQGGEYVEVQQVTYTAEIMAQGIPCVVPPAARVTADGDHWGAGLCFIGTHVINRAPFSGSGCRRGGTHAQACAHAPRRDALPTEITGVSDL